MKQAIIWWENLPLEERQNLMYYTCQAQEKGAFEFTTQDIISIYITNQK